MVRSSWLVRSLEFDIRNNISPRPAVRSERILSALARLSSTNDSVVLPFSRGQAGIALALTHSKLDAEDDFSSFIAAYGVLGVVGRTATGVRRQK